MLFEPNMTKLTASLMGYVFDLALWLVPNTKKEFHVIDNRPQIGQILNGWEYRETVSSDSGMAHRYYFHPGPHGAPVFLFLHGLFLDGRNFLNVKSLSDKWQLIAYDFPESSPLYRGDMSDFKYLLDDFLDTLKIDTLYLCGVSFGGGIAARFAASHARRVKALALVSSFIMNSSLSDRHRSRTLAKFILKHPDHKLQWLIKFFFDLSRRNSHSNLHKVSSIIKIRDINWYRQVIHSITTCEGPEDAVQIRCPVLAIHGSKDNTISIKSALSIPKHIPHARFEKIKDGSHAMMFDHGEQIAAMIREFCVNEVDENSDQ
jgi:pimeloyl-ACP methyl ester carboxylesterase